MEASSGTVTPIEEAPGAVEPVDPAAQEPEAPETPPETPEEPAQAPPEGDFEGEGQEEQPRIFELELEGDRKALNGSMGGRKPDTASVKLRGGSAIVPEGQYDKGDVVNLLIKVRCTELHGIDKMDNSTGEIVSTERRHIFKVMGVEKVSGGE
jgi:hypothetical protein